MEFLVIGYMKWTPLYAVTLDNLCLDFGTTVDKSPLARNDSLTSLIYIYYLSP